jgi:hypothetical protein
LARENLLIQGLLDEAKRDLEASNLLLKTDLIEIAAWHTEQAFEKAIMFVYASYKIKFQGRAVDSVHDKMEEKLHTEKHMLMVNMLNEMIPDFGAFIDKRMNPLMSQLPPDLLADLTGFLGKNNPNQTVSKAGKQLGKIRSASQANPAKSMTLEQFLDQCTADNFKKDVARSDIQPSILTSLESLKQAGSFNFGNKELGKAFEMAGLDRPDLYLALYRFPSAALGIAGWILSDPISTRYPQRKHDYANLKLYRARVPALRGFYLEVNQQIENLIKYGEQFLEAFLLLRKLGVQKV